MIHNMNKTADDSTRRAEQLRARRRLLGARIAELRNERGWTQRELGGRVGIPCSRLSRIETGQADPLFRDLFGLRQVFGVPLDALVAGGSGGGAPLADVRLRDLLRRIERTASPEIRDSLVTILRAVAASLRLVEAAGRPPQVPEAGPAAPPRPRGGADER